MRKDKVVTEVLREDSSLTPSEIHNREFSRSFMGGYQRNDVREFLERISDLFESLLEQNRLLREESETQRIRIEEHAGQEQSLRNALASAQKLSEDVVMMAKREAHTLVEEARLMRAQAQLEMAKLPMMLSRDIRLLEQQRQRLRVELLSIIETHKRLLDDLIPENVIKQPPSFLDVAHSEGAAPSKTVDSISSSSEQINSSGQGL